jgi:hypothetical protein
LKENVEKRQKYQYVSDRRNGPNEPTEAEEYCSFSATQESFEKGHLRRAYFGVPEECRLVLECDEILFCRVAILGLNSEEASSSLKDDGLDEVNEAILLALSDELFSSARQ